MESINIAQKLQLITEFWSPRSVAVVNDYDVRLVKIQGEFVRHKHDESDELFLALDGELTIRMDSGDVILKPGELYVVPRSVEHQPVSEHGASILLFEPSEIVNTGDAGGDLTAARIEI
jgi:mannose-6-phosphate isomerase-like protein (cupin superfamily)